LLSTPLFLQGTEWVIVAVILGALLFFGPEKIPELARSIGRAKAEFDKASREARGVMDMAVKSIDESAKATASSVESAFNPSLGTPSAPSTTSPTPSLAPSPLATDPLIEVAHKLGIETAGKTKEEISNEILQKAGGKAEAQAPQG
jgi:sec-independent protein translocase protein TatA